MKKRKRILLGIIISIALTVTAIVLSISSTQAFLSHSDTSDRKNNYSTGILSITALSNSDNISLNGAVPMTDEQGAAQEPYIFTIKNNGNVDYQFDVQLLSTSANTFDPQYIKLKIDDSEVTTLSALTNSKIKTGLTLGAQQTLNISIRMWLASNTPNTQIGKTFTSQLVVNGVAVYTTTNHGLTAAAYITNLYNNAAKTVVTNNNINYNYATSVSLMNDRLGGTTKDLNAGNIRYYGANPNNYIWLGETYTSDYTIPGNVTLWGYTDVNDCVNDDNLLATCTEDIVRHTGDRKLYRIIGVFDNMLKVVAVDSIGNYSWDTSASAVNSGYGINEWTQADLMKLLNPGYDSDTVNNSLYWNKASGTCYKADNNTTASCDFTNIGLSDSVKNKIATVIWNLGSFSDSQGYANAYYGYERGTTHIDNPADGVTREDTWTGKVGLIYPSDYGYAVNFSSCVNKQVKDNSAACLSNNWMHNYSDYWTISSGTDDPLKVWRIYAAGDSDALAAGAANHWDAVRPVFYLNAEESIKSGTGTSADPYILR